jgi:ribonuclease VapC
MIAVDTSALMAILLGEPGSDRLRAALQSDAVVISAGTLAEALIVAKGRNLGPEMSDLVEALGVEVAPLTASAARKTAEAYARWGKGFNRAGLNFGDCFAYVTAQEYGCPLLYVGDDFAKTDLAPAV